MKIIDNGVTYSGTATEIVAQLHAGSFTPSASDQTWMEEVADRAYTQTGHDISTATAEEFLRGMIRAGLFKNGEGKS